MQNEITLIGEVQSIEQPFESYGQKFNQMVVGVKRLSGNIDYINIVYRPIPNVTINTLDRVKITGEVRTRNVKVDDKSKLKVYVFGEIVELVVGLEDTNAFVIEGYVCKNPSARKTPRGIDVTDIMIAHNTNTGKSFYLPTIAFGKEAIRAASLISGNKVRIEGRFQSRDYNKVVDGNTLTFTAYELALTTFTEIE